MKVCFWIFKILNFNYGFFMFRMFLIMKLEIFRDFFFYVLIILNFELYLFIFLYFCVLRFSESIIIRRRLLRDFFDFFCWSFVFFLRVFSIRVYFYYVVLKSFI